MTASEGQDVAASDAPPETCDWRNEPGHDEGCDYCEAGEQRA